MEVANVSSVGDPERMISGRPARLGGGDVESATSAAGIHQVSGTRTPAARARRRLSSLGTEESLNRSQRPPRHRRAPPPRPWARRSWDSGPTPGTAATATATPRAAAVQSSSRRRDHRVPSAPPDLDPLQRLRPARQFPFQRPQQPRSQPSEKIRQRRAPRIAVEESRGRLRRGRMREVLPHEPALERRRREDSGESPLHQSETHHARHPTALQPPQHRPLQDDRNALKTTAGAQAERQQTADPRGIDQVRRSGAQMSLQCRQERIQPCCPRPPLESWIGCFDKIDPPRQKRSGGGEAGRAVTISAEEADHRGGHCAAIIPPGGPAASSWAWRRLR